MTALARPGRIDLWPGAWEGSRMKAWLPLVAALATPAFADGDPPAAPGSPPVPPIDAPPSPPPPPPTITDTVTAPPKAAPLQGKDITITTPGERTTKNIELLGGMAVGAAVLLGLGAYFNLDSQSAANAASANVGVDLNNNVTSSGRVWTADDLSNYDRAHDSAIKAGIFYGVGGALLVGTIVTLIVTVPKSETTIIHPHNAMPTVAPTQGGALFGGAWSF